MKRISLRQTYPKEQLKKANETIKELRAQINKLEKEKRLLEEEMLNLMKPIRIRKENRDSRKLTSEEWRLDFVRRWKESQARKKEQIE